MTTSAGEFTPVPPAPHAEPVAIKRIAALPPTESVALDCIERAHNHGHSALMNIAIARDCPSLRADHLALASKQLAHATDELASAIAAQTLHEMTGGTDSDAGVLEAMPPAAPGPSIRCNACNDPDNCSQCRTLNAERDARFGPPASYADPAR